MTDECWALFMIAQATPTPAVAQANGSTVGEQIFNGIVALCAVAALLLSIWQEYARRQSGRPRIRVTMSTGIIGFPDGPSNGELFVEAANIGEKPVTLSSQALLQLPDRNRMLLPPANGRVVYPFELHPGKNCVSWIELAQLANQLRTHGMSRKCELVGIYRDQLDNTYKSKPFEFDPSGWPDVGSDG